MLNRLTDLSLLTKKKYPPSFQRENNYSLKKSFLVLEEASFFKDLEYFT
jgi:hypothetical protein